MKTNNKKGFTLVELIVVIVIIGILAAVLIPKLLTYIESSKKSNDIKTANDMTLKLSLYCTENEIDVNDMPGVTMRSTLLNFGYNLTPITDKWTFVYNKSKRAIEVYDIDDNIIKLSADEERTSLDDITEFVPGYYLVGRGSSDVEQALTEILTTFNNSELNSIKNSNGKYAKYAELVVSELENTLFVNNAGVLNSKDMNCDKVLLQEGLIYLPNVRVEDGALTEDAILINKTIDFVVSGGNLYDHVKIENKPNEITLNGLSSLVSISGYDGDPIKTEYCYDYESNQLYYIDGETKHYVTYDQLLTRSQIQNMTFTINEQYSSDTNMNITFGRLMYIPNSLSPIGAIYKMSILFTKDYIVVGYKELFYYIEF